MLNAGATNREASASWTHARILASSTAANIVAVAPTWIQPVLVSEILAKEGASEASVGLLLTVELVALSLSSALYARIGRRFSFRAILLGGCFIAGVGTLLSCMATSFAFLVAMRIVSGLGEGATLMVFSAAPARLRDPERAYAQINAINIIGGMALIAATPLVGRLTHGAAAFPLLLLNMLLLFPVLLLMPARERLEAPRQDGARGAAGALSWPVLLLAAAVLISTAPDSAIWSFSFVLGARTGLDSGAISDATTLAIACSFGVSLLVGLAGNRFGRLGPIIVSLAIITAAGYAASNSMNPAVFRVGLIAYMIALYVMLPYAFGFVASADPGGRGAAFLGGAFIMAQAIGPSLGGLVAGNLGYAALGWCVIAGNCVAATLYLVVWLELRRRSADLPLAIEHVPEGEASSPSL